MAAPIFPPPQSLTWELTMRSLTSALWQRFLRYFLAGILAVMPLALTGMIVIWLAGFLNGFVGPTSFVGQQLSRIGVANGTPTVPADSEDINWIAYLFGWVIVLGVVFLIGMLVETGLKNTFNSLVDSIVIRVPLIGKLYGTARQLVGMLDKQDDGELRGMKAVFVMFGKENGAGILALMPTSDRYDINGVDYHGVYLPTSPLPMTGGIVFVPCDAVQPVEMSVDGLMSIYLSMGVTAPQFLQTSGKGMNKKGPAPKPE
ncbi:hypothetical protein DSM3645_25111 [Blastopirellula marina DSM 3645]|uniref:DUF502 domain-containing protein n=2 Tax=Blastopirellula marina TaxID=124 RepID=A4A2E8_9BACT|nr:hypothetical protein DSM3645_25111 [Blastopirellula marina DSM 3645]